MPGWRDEEGEGAAGEREKAQGGGGGGEEEWEKGSVGEAQIGDE